MGQKVSFETSVTCPTVAPAVSKLDLTFKTEPFLSLILKLEVALLLINEDDSSKKLDFQVEETLQEAAIGCAAGHDSDGEERTVDGGETENWRTDIFSELRKLGEGRKIKKNLLVGVLERSIISCKEEVDWSERMTEIVF